MHASQRAASARRAREVRLRNAAVAAAAEGRLATAHSAGGAQHWIHPAGGRPGIRTGHGNLHRAAGGGGGASRSGDGVAGMVAVGSRTGSRRAAGGVRPGTAGSNAAGGLLRSLTSRLFRWLPSDSCESRCFTY